MQQKPWCRTERFLACEKPLLGALPERDFELKEQRVSTVAQNGHIYLSQDKHYYSVPFQHTATKVTVIYTRSVVSIYARGKRIAMHPRDTTPGEYTTTREHLCPAHQHYQDRSPAYYLGKARCRCEQLTRLFEAMFAQQDRSPEQLYNSCDGLLALHRKTDPGDFARACATAREHEQYSSTFIRNMLANNMAGNGQTEQTKRLPRHANVRGKDYYATTPTHKPLNT